MSLSRSHCQSRNKIALALAALGLSTLLAGAASAETLIMATDRIGSIMNATGAGLAKVVTKHSRHRVIIRAFAGPDSYVEAVNSGEIALAAMSASSAWIERQGKAKKRGKMSDIRILRSGGGALRLTFVASVKSGIKTLKDLKGHRVASSFGGHAVVGPAMAAALETAGLTWKDLKAVPVTGVVDGGRALASGRVDASWASFGMPVIREAHAKMGVRYLSLIDTPAAKAIIVRRFFPGIKFVKMKARPKMGLPEPASLLTYDTYLLSHKGLSSKIVLDILTGLWDNSKELRKIHFGLRGFTNESAATTLPVMPYHPAAIAFYKSKGVWSAEVAAANAKLN